MELQRGVCSLCSENTRVLNSSDAEESSKFLPEILYENFLPEDEFQKIKKQIKVCLICCYKVKAAVETRNAFNNNKENENIRSSDECHFCKTNQNLVKIDSNWKHFLDRTEGFLTFQDFPVTACVGCIFYFDTIFNIKSKLVYKFPQLAVPVQKKKTNGSAQKQNDFSKRQNETPKRKSQSKSPPSSKKRKIFDDCFAYLQPLCNNKLYHVDDELKRDKRLYKKIAYVNLKNSKDVTVRETPKMRPIIKIKLKPKKESHVYVKMTRSEEMPSKSEYRQSKGRRYSHVEGRESSEEPETNLEETPKAAAASSLVPKRRVSTYIDNGEEEENTETKGESCDEIENIIDKYAKKDEITGEDKDKSEESKDADINENGVEKLITKSTEDKGEETKDLANGEKSDTLPECEEEEKENQSSAVAEDTVSLSSGTSDSPKTSSKNDGSSDGSDSDTSDKTKLKGNNTESDSLNGSERKKKRVTFSDELI